MATFPVVLTWVRRAGGRAGVWTRLQAPRVDIPISEMNLAGRPAGGSPGPVLDGTMEP